MKLAQMKLYASVFKRTRCLGIINRQFFVTLYAFEKAVIAILARQFEFEGKTLVEAIKATFNRRSTAIPKETPTAFSNKFASDNDKNKQWLAFLSRTGLGEMTLSLPQVIDELKQFILPPLDAAAQEQQFNQSWIAGGSWS